MNARTFFMKILFASPLLCALPVFALEILPYDPARLQTLQQQGKPVALDFHADWCSTCKLQDKALNQLKSESGLDITVLRVDYDKEKELRKTHKIRYQSTIVVFKGEKETGRILGDTEIDKIRTGLKGAL
jgi:thiol:disulfide interchange protein